MGSRVYFED